MSLKNKTIPVILCLLPLLSFAQAIDNSLSIKNINRDSYIRFNYENDVFSRSDIYYTQGMHLEVAAPGLRHFPLSKLLLHPRSGYRRYSISAEHNGYTPTSISDEAILYGDRPFGACLFLKTALVSVDSIRRQRFSSSISTGVMGQAAGGMEMQVGIHRWLNNITPHGWQYQLHNDFIVNYQVGYEKQLIASGKVFSMDVSTMGRVGTLSDKASIGGTVMFGFFDSPYGAQVPTNMARGIPFLQRFRIYAYEHPEVSFVAWDATLQGGMFNHTSPYTINAGDITRITFQNRFGIVLVYRRLQLEYFQSYLSNEFRTGNYHVWGGVQIAVGL